LYGALALALAGFAAAAAANPFWRSHRPVELGLAVIMAAVPPALALLLGRLRRSHDELSRLCQQMERLVRHDALTGLLNAQLLQEGLAQHVASAARHGRPLAVLFVDLDNFKVINDTRGHAAGDALLRQIAARMRLCVRCSDLVARVGGDEFVLVLTEMQTPENALFVAEKLVRVLSGEPFVLAEGAPITVTTSIGVAIYPEAGQVAERLLASADCAMYRAKRQGRNQWCRFSEGDAEIWEGARCAVGGPA
ncbi:MAG TPA: GGDEF domain-containing protein, partial [Acidiferrobacteraceae bacterium]|nr:GGDEF domain-containing protein [Acidiferrobacteraceae bacterium]